MKWLLIPFLALLIVACNDKVKPPVKDITDSDEIPAQESWNSKIMFSDSGVVRATVYADHIRVYESQLVTLLDSNVLIDFYDRDGLHSSQLRADRGKVNDATKDLEAFDNIVFTSDSGTVVETDYLYWDHDSKKVRSDKFVEITSPKERLQGYGFEADQSLKNYVIRRISGEVELEEGIK
jgi:lipopolysaccharide export system protein LptC